MSLPNLVASTTSRRRRPSASPSSRSDPPLLPYESAVSKKVIPTSRAAETTSRVPSRSSLFPKLLHPRPTTETTSPDAPRGRCRMWPSCLALGWAHAVPGARSGTCPAHGCGLCRRVRVGTTYSAEAIFAWAGRLPTPRGADNDEGPRANRPGASAPMDTSRQPDSPVTPTGRPASPRALPPIGPTAERSSRPPSRLRWPYEPARRRPGWGRG